MSRLPQKTGSDAVSLHLLATDTSCAASTLQEISGQGEGDPLSLFPGCFATVSKSPLISGGNASRDVEFEIEMAYGTPSRVLEEILQDFDLGESEDKITHTKVLRRPR